jgi:predicted dehydrogenase
MAFVRPNSQTLVEKCVNRLRVGIVGVGKIAKEQHIPALRANAAFELVACASRHAKVDGVANYPNLESMLDGRPDLDAVAICTPPQVHYEETRLALQRGKHVFLEKPPCSTTTQLDALALQARQSNCTLFQTWHAQCAAAVDTAQLWLKPCVVRNGRVVWKENVRQWHPGQDWIWQAGGFGVFDAGINAVSILTKIVAEPIFVKAANLFFPANCDSPVAANVTFATGMGAVIDAAFDFRHTGVPTWDIDVATDRGALCLSAYGSTLAIDGKQVAAGTAEAEYQSLYRHFADLVRRHESDVDKRPLQLVADIFLVAKRLNVDPFEP